MLEGSLGSGNELAPEFKQAFTLSDFKPPTDAFKEFAGIGAVHDHLTDGVPRRLKPTVSGEAVRGMVREDFIERQEGTFQRSDFHLGIKNRGAPPSFH